jgi:hypothetical protein
MEPKRKTRKPFDSQQVISWLITIIGIIAAIYAVKKGVEFATIAMITAEALLAFGWAYIIYYRKRDKEIIEEKDSQIKNLKDRLYRTFHFLLYPILFCEPFEGFSSCNLLISYGREV